MAGALKHMLRSHRSYHKNVDFTDFHRKASFAEAKKMQRMSLLDMIKAAVTKTKETSVTTTDEQ